MNKIYRLIWSSRCESFVVVSEISRGGGRSGGKSILNKLLLVAFFLGFLATKNVNAACSTTNVSGLVFIDGDCNSGYVLPVGQTAVEVDLLSSATVENGILINGNINGGAGANYYGVGFFGGNSVKGGITNNGVINANSGSGVGTSSSTDSIDFIKNNNSITANQAIQNAGSIGVISNTGSLIGDQGLAGGETFGVLNFPDAVINSLSNSSTGAIKASTSDGNNATGIYNYGMLSALSNTGGAIITATTVDGAAYAINNSGAITTLVNDGASRISAVATGVGAAIGIQSTGTIQSLTNSGSAIISAETTYGFSYGMIVQGSINSLSNAGNATISAISTISGPAYGIQNDGGNITSLSNGDSAFIKATSVDADANAVYSSGAIGGINNTGSARISSVTSGAGAAYGIQSYGGTIGVINNSNSAIVSGQATGVGGSVGIFNNNGGTIAVLNNSDSATISALSSGIGDASGISNNGAITTLNNSGNASIVATNSGGDSYGVYNPGTITNINNSGSAKISASNSGNGFSFGIYNAGAIGALNNSGSAKISAINTGSGSSIGVRNEGAIAGLNNSGVISASTASGGSVAIWNGGTINVLNNTGVISATATSGDFLGIYNQFGTIGTFNNAQGGSGSSPSATALTLFGNLPSYYNIIISSQTRYGQLSTDGTTVVPTTFGIYPGSYATLRHIYAGVLQGVSSNYVNGVVGSSVFGSSNGYTFVLSETDVVNGIWSLDVLSAPVNSIDTQASLINTASALQNTYTLQNSVLANGFSYDCQEFGANGVCISVGGRNTAVQAANGLNNTSGLLIAAYRPHQHYRIGAYIDQNLSVNNTGSTVSLGNNTPMIGLFGAWVERLDGTGTEVKVSAAYGQKNTTITRPIVNASEPGSGSSTLNSQGAQITAKYGFAVLPQVIASPYIGIRYTQNNMGGYAEVASSTVTVPLTYSALNTNATTALAGLGASYRFIPKAIVFASAGIETDTNTANGTYAASGLAGLTPINFNANPVKTRPTATLGAYYDVEKNQRVGITGIYRQEPFQAVSTTTVMATYTIGM